MKRRLSALSVSAAALLVAAPLLTGCTTDSRPGIAAVVGDEQISLSQVQNQVEAVRQAQREDENADQLIAASAQLPRETVNYLVYQEVVELAAADAGVDVSRREVQQERANLEENAGGVEELERAALMQNGLPLASEHIDGVLRTQLLIQRLAEKIGAGPDERGQEMLGQLLANTGEEAGVQVNPRYGRWDPEVLSLVDADMPWLRVPTMDDEEA